MFIMIVSMIKRFNINEIKNDQTFQFLSFLEIILPARRVKHYKNIFLDARDFTGALETELCASSHMKQDTEMPVKRSTRMYPSDYLWCMSDTFEMV